MRSHETVPSQQCRLTSVAASVVSDSSRIVVPEIETSACIRNYFDWSVAAFGCSSYCSDNVLTARQMFDDVERCGNFTRKIEMYSQNMLIWITRIQSRCLANRKGAWT
jgi:hypothetical protein